MPATNLFEELKAALTTFKEFLDENVATIKPAIQALSAIVPEINDLITQLITLMNSLKEEIEDLNPGQVGEGLTKVTEFTNATKTLLTTAKDLLTDQADEIDSVLSVVNVVSSLPSLDAVKAEIIALIVAIIANLNQLKS